MLEPYTIHKDILYVIACANDSTVINEAKQFFNELSITYEVSEVIIKKWIILGYFRHYLIHKLIFIKCFNVFIFI